MDVPKNGTDASKDITNVSKGCKEASKDTTAVPKNGTKSSNDATNAQKNGTAPAATPSAGREVCCFYNGCHGCKPAGDLYGGKDEGQCKEYGGTWCTLDHLVHDGPSNSLETLSPRRRRAG